MSHQKSSHSAADPAVVLSVVLPVFNEEACIEATLDELFEVLRSLDGRSEVLAIDDGSTDRTPDILRHYRNRESSLRVLTLSANSGQSAAFGTGFARARGATTVLMDADGQNDPHDIPLMLRALECADVCCGIRRHRKDSRARRWAGKVANRVRSLLLRDGVEDTGCSLKAIRTALLRDLPMKHAGMHRFIPALLLMKGARIAQIPVNHRPRRAGRSKYTNLGRLRVTVADLLAIRWMKSRYRHFNVSEDQ